MEVLIKFGRHEGEIRDIAPEAALAMLADGRGERPNTEQERAEVCDLFEVPAEIVGEIESSRAFPPAEMVVPGASLSEELAGLTVHFDCAPIIPAPPALQGAARKRRR